MNALFLGTVFVFTSMIYLFHVVVPDLAPGWFQRLSYLLLALISAASAYGYLIVGKIA